MQIRRKLRRLISKYVAVSILGSPLSLLSSPPGVSHQAPIVTQNATLTLTLGHKIGDLGVARRAKWRLSQSYFYNFELSRIMLPWPRSHNASLPPKPAFLNAGHNLKSIMFWNFSSLYSASSFHANFTVGTHINFITEKYYNILF